MEWLKGLGLEPVDCYLRLMPPLKEENELLRQELQLMVKDDEDVRLLMSIPGAGYYTALLLKAEVGEVGRFTFKECLCSYSGLVPSTKSSGVVEMHGRITRERFQWLRWAMVEAAMVHVRQDSPVTRF